MAGLFQGKAVFVIDGGAPRTIAVGKSTPEGVKLVAIEDETAVVEYEGRRQRLRLGETVAASKSSGPGGETVVLKADSRGHFFANGMVNGIPIHFMVDTGATSIALGISDARRAGVNVQEGEPILTQTANGVAQAWRVRLRSVKVGSVTLTDVDGSVLSIDMPHALLGMSFLNRMDMQRSGESMTLRKRF